MKKCLKIAIIAGEESGDLLAADLVRAMRQHNQMPIELVGVGGQHLTQLGLKSLFAMEEIALIGLAQIIRKLPRLIRYLHHTVAQIIAARPDCLIVVDAPDFTHRVAARVRKKLPDLPIIQYVAPTVWAWRPERAGKMRRFIDHLLVVLPFEVAALRDLGGPPATYVGHPLLFDTQISKARAAQAAKHEKVAKQPLLLVLPGSRRSEIRNLMPLFGEAVGHLHKRIPDLRVVLPTLERHHDEVRHLAQNWTLRPDITSNRFEKMQAFVEADAALAASGTVTLELALAQIPMIACYKADWFARMFILPRISIWSASLPNLIADAPIVPEYYNEFIRPALLARQLQRHMVDGAPRTAQREGFATMLENMQTPLPSSCPDSSAGKIAARTIFELIDYKNR